MPTVSVIIPAYNAERWIGRTLDSVSAQTVRDIEILVIDDGSKDSTAEIIRRHAEADPRIRLIQQPNSGVTPTRNRGIAEAAAPFIAPLDSDDLWHPTRLEAHLATFAAGGEDVALVYSGYRRIDENDRVFWTVNAPPIEGWVFEPHLCENFIGNGSGITVRTEVMREVGGYPYTRDGSHFEIAEDWLMQLRIAYRHRIARAPGFLVAYRAVSGSLSGDRLRRRRWDTVALQEIEGYATEVPRYVFWFPEARACCKYVWELAHAHRWGDVQRVFWGEFFRNPLVGPYMVYMILERISWKLFPGLKPSSQTRFIPEGERPLFYDVDPAETPAKYSSVSTPMTLAIYRWLGARRGKRAITPPAR